MALRKIKNIQVAEDTEVIPKTAVGGVATAFLRLN